MEVLVGEGPPPTVDEITPVTVTMDRGFVCLDEGVGTELVIADVEGTAPDSAVGDQVVIVSDGDCLYDLVYRTNSEDIPLSDDPGGYILASAKRFTEPDATLICASDVLHLPGSEEPNERLVQSVVVRCWARLGAAPFVALPDAVVPEGANSGDSSEHAAWIDDVSFLDGTYRVHWLRDFSFQFLNMSDVGRPATDGAYRTELSFDGSTLTAGATTQESGSVLGPPPETGEWTPGPDEKTMADGLFNITDGECADGCLP
jgi:hypothetical protein